MGDMTLGEMLAMQQQLQEKYKGKWEPIGPATGKNKLLWMVGEVGEVAEIIKKNGHERIMEQGPVRAHFVEEMADVLMYYGDIMNCFSITPEELKASYTEKFQRNMERW
ncbi:MAG: nucleotide pyrophosphohydrolase [Clostridia bacterium]|nr:nucleotide pyrophosphohydrolase [Clostridia bacterium]